MSDSSSRATATASVPGFVRNLGAFEEIYWLYNQLGAHGFAYAMEVGGPTIVADWQSALDAIQRSHPFFSVCIEPNGGAVPFFRHVDVTYTSQTSIPSLLPAIEQLLREACHSIV